MVWQKLGISKMRTKWGLLCGVCSLLAASLTGCPPTPTGKGPNVVLTAVVDFEGLAPGTVVDSLSTGAGIDGVLLGSITVLGWTPTLVGNTAVVFNSSYPTGRDWDLGTPNEAFGGPGIGKGGATNTEALGNILILAEDLVDTSPPDGLIDDPDDTFYPGASLYFDFSTLDGGVVNVLDLTVLDVEDTGAGAFVEVSGPSLPPTRFPIPFTDDNGVAIMDINTEGVNRMVVTMDGSGGIGDLRIEQEVVEVNGGFIAKT
jgi:hypothetical protein